MQESRQSSGNQIQVKPEENSRKGQNHLIEKRKLASLPQEVFFFLSKESISAFFCTASNPDRENVKYLHLPYENPLGEKKNLNIFKFRT